MSLKSCHKIGLSPTRKIVLGFLLIILTGAILLTMPFSQREGVEMDFIDALFTSVSATCVTGLVRADTALCFNTFGQGVILSLIQIGGIGFMTVAVMLLSSLGKKISISDKLTLAGSYGLSSVGGIIVLMKRVILGTAFFELLGSALLCIKFIPFFGVGEGIRQSIFHSVSAFCNAGFDILGPKFGAYAGISAFAKDPLVLITLSFLIIIGGIGFIVWDDAWLYFKERKRISVYSRIVLISSAFLLISGALFFAIAEWNNVETIGGFKLFDKIVVSFFQSATARTAGFSAVDMAVTNESTRFIFLFLMFIGGSAGSTAGGIKTATTTVIAAALLGFIRGKKKTSMFKRTIPSETISRAFAVAATQLTVTMTATLILIAQGQTLMAALFECISASATVGLSLSLTPSLPLLSEAVIMLLMFLGRVGVITFAYSIKNRVSESEFETEYAKANIMIG